MNSVQSAVEMALRYLVSRQHADGHWSDYELPMGASDAWVTAYVGLALVAVEHEHEAARSAAARAGDWLSGGRQYAAGWGYNGRTGPDSDSTAHALLLLGALGMPRRHADIDWLEQRWHPSGGFSTYSGPGAWGLPHPDVTPLAFLALPEATQRHLRAPLLEYMSRERRSDGTWGAYWWRRCHYSTYWNSLVLQRVDPGAHVTLALECDQHDRRIDSSFDLAFAIGLARLAADETLRCERVAAALNAQAEDGSWPGGRDLRVTHHDCRAPWVEPVGEYYEDHARLITTASMLRMLSSGA